MKKALYSSKARDVELSEPEVVPPSRAFVSLSFGIYRAGPSRIRGVSCPMSPHCSEFGRGAFARHGIIAGTLMTADRILRCGHDLRRYESLGAGQFKDPVQ